MRGHLRERSPGHWAIVIDVRDPQTGKRKRRWHSFEGTKRQAQIECARLIAEMQGGVTVDPSRITVAEFLDRFQRDWVALHVRRPQRNAMQHLSPLCVVTLATGAYRRSGPLILRAYMQPWCGLDWRPEAWSTCTSSYIGRLGRPNFGACFGTIPPSW
jgi:hypothetical protein